MSFTVSEFLNGNIVSKYSKSANIELETLHNITKQILLSLQYCAGHTTDLTC